MLWTLILGAALAAQAPAQAPAQAHEFGGASEPMHLVGASAFSTLGVDAELVELDEMEALEGPPGGVRGRLESSWVTEVPPAPLLLGLVASAGPGLVALSYYVYCCGFGPLLLAGAHSFIGAPVLGVVGGVLLLRAAQGAGLEKPQLAVAALAMSIAGLAASGLGALALEESSGVRGVGLLISGAALPMVAGGVLVAGAVQHGRRAQRAELRIGLALVEQGAQAGLTLRF